MGNRPQQLPPLLARPLWFLKTGGVSFAPSFARFTLTIGRRPFDGIFVGLFERYVGAHAAWDRIAGCKWTS